MREGVLLLHGITRTAASLARLERSLASAGFATLNLDYPSRHHALAELVDYVHRKAGPFMAQQRVHLVTHSMGGLLARAYIARHRPPGLGRAVLLAPPNGGSEITDLLLHTAFYRRLFGPAGQQLGTNDALSALLGPVDYPLGVIAGTRALDPLGWLYLPRPNDGRVSVARTRVDGMAGHLTLPVTHTFLLRNPAVIRHVIHFLRSGTFGPSS